MSAPPLNGKPGVLPTVALEVLESVHQHRLLTARQVHALHTPTTSLRWTQHILAMLDERGLADRAVGPHGQGLWFITRHGADTLHAPRTEPRTRLTTAAQAAGALRAHTLAVNDTGIAFLQAAREHEHDDCGPHAWRHEIAHTIAPRRGRRPAQMVIADALLSYLQATSGASLTLHKRFIELDRGTLPVDRLAAKLTLYAQLHRYTPTPAPAGAPPGPLWRTYYRVFPSVLVVLADQTPAACRRRIQRVIALHDTDPARKHHGTVPISFVALPDLTARGPFAPIFITVAQPEKYIDWLENPQPTQR
jgi:hypothetical protein